MRFRRAGSRMTWRGRAYPAVVRIALSLLIGLAAALPGGDDLGPLDKGDPPTPGIDAPASPAEPCVIAFDWDEYHTVVVVGEGVGMVKPAWVTTYDREPRTFIVGYRATAYRDARGRLHINARRALDVGPKAKEWSPDSFAFGDKLLWAVDDENRGQSAPMGSLLLAATEAKGWRSALLQAQALVEGGL